MGSRKKTAACSAFRARTICPSKPSLRGFSANYNIVGLQDNVLERAERE